MDVPDWIKKQKIAENFEVVKGEYDMYKDFTADPSGYFLVRINREDKLIEVAHCTNEHVITKVFTGKIAYELFHTIIKAGVISRLDHAAYLGTELKKAEIALQRNEPYEQE